MGMAIGMLELSSIARGIETSDYMVKEARVDLIRSSTVCPGKYIILVAGDTDAVKAAMKEGVTRAETYLVDSLQISNVHEELVPALSGTVTIENPGAVGVIEFYSVASAILAADEAVKAANITLIEVRIGYAIGGKGFVTLTGDVGAVRAAVAAAKTNAELYIESTVIPRPSPEVFQSLL